MDKTIFERVQRMLKEREEYYGKTADKTENYVVKCGYLDRASAYHSAWWMMEYALTGNEECLNEMDYFG